jgi:hypothetical protein
MDERKVYGLSTVGEPPLLVEVVPEGALDRIERAGHWSRHAQNSSQLQLIQDPPEWFLLSGPEMPTPSSALEKCVDRPKCEVLELQALAL